jgi:hypothetical protein
MTDRESNAVSCVSLLACLTVNHVSSCWPRSPSVPHQDSWCYLSVRAAFLLYIFMKLASHCLHAFMQVTTTQECIGLQKIAGQWPGATKDCSGDDGFVGQSASLAAAVIECNNNARQLHIHCMLAVLFLECRYTCRVMTHLHASYHVCMASSSQWQDFIISDDLSYHWWWAHCAAQ